MTLSSRPELEESSRESGENAWRLMLRVVHTRTSPRTEEYRAGREAEVSVKL